jgi:aspartyl-tRNA(Asn)/glutamyl-tRNA(Gln) amidotransferase subunit B
MINLIKDGIISGKIAKEIFPTMVEENKDPEDIVNEKNLIQISDENEIVNIIEVVLNVNKSQVNSYHNGNEKVFGFFVGQIMRETKGKANPQIVNKLLKVKLDSLKKV